jgi:hypothetical protein
VAVTVAVTSVMVVVTVVVTAVTVDIAECDMASPIMIVAAV